MATTREPFESECWYHIFNHARGSDNIFEAKIDYQIFLNLIEKYILPVANVYAYCLMSNHFHFLVQNKNVEVPESFSNGAEADFISHQWGNVQNTYTKKKNYRTGKRGGLFCQSINRNLINSEEYRQFVWFIFIIIRLTMDFVFLLLTGNFLRINRLFQKVKQGLIGVKF